LRALSAWFSARSRDSSSSAAARGDVTKSSKAAIFFAGMIVVCKQWVIGEG
jgi:hypothetical protein